MLMEVGQDLKYKNTIITLRKSGLLNKFGSGKAYLTTLCTYTTQTKVWETIQVFSEHQ
jgi:hypothetical protein